MDMTSFIMGTVVVTASAFGSVATLDQWIARIDGESRANETIICQQEAKAYSANKQFESACLSRMNSYFDQKLVEVGALK